MGRSARSKGTSKPGKPRPTEKEPPAVPIQQGTGRGIAEVVVGGIIVLAGFVITALSFDTASTSNGKFALAYGPVIAGLALVARGAIRLSPATDATLPPRSDHRRWVYGGLALFFAVVQAVCLIKVIPNRLPGAWLHLWSFPVFTALMAAGTLAGRRLGWWFAVLAGTGVIVSLGLAIVRILISAAFLAGVYGAFGKAGATFSLVAVALMIEVVALLPIAQVKWLMTRSGRRAYGV